MKHLIFRFTALILCILTLAFPAHALTLEEAFSLLEDYYIDDLPEQASQAQTIEELIGTLNDPYTVYMDKETYENFIASINDTRLVGIGVSIEAHHDGVMIASVLDNSPALEAGLIPGDIIHSVEGTFPTTLEHARTLLAGEENTSVTITVIRTDGSVSDFTLIRREITIPSTVQHALSDDGNALVIACSSFGNEAPDHFANAIDEHDELVNGYIVDLSANPGGTSDSGTGVAGCFIGSETTVYMRDGQDIYSYYYVLPGNVPKTQKPAISLTSSYTASSSELFLGAIRDHRSGIAIGQRTHGKGVAQIAVDKNYFPDLFDGDALKITIYRFFSPNGATNDQIGVMPTLLISLENAYNAALLLCADVPEDPSNHLKLTMGGHIFFINLDTALSPQFRPAFVELLEAVPPTINMRWNKGEGSFVDITGSALAEALGLSEFRSRSFFDLAACSQADSINTLAAYGLLSGYGDGSFRPNSTMTRAEFCAMLANLLYRNLPPVEQSSFFDVGVTDWYAPAVHALYKKGLLSGYADGSFHPNNTISQQEVVSILAQLSTQLNMYAYNRRNLTPNEETMTTFSHFSDWAQHSAWLLESSEVDLSSLTAPQNGISRALAADLLCQLLIKSHILWL